MAETNQLLLNYYKKVELQKVKQMANEKVGLQEILQSVDMKYLNKEEIFEILGEDYEKQIENNKKIQEEVNGKLNTNNDSLKLKKPMEIAREYNKYFEEYKQNRKQICKDKNISNGTFQKYMRLNYLIPELQYLVDNVKIGINSAEQLSFLDKEYQIIVYELIKNYNCEITTSIAKRIKEEYIFSKERLNNYILNKTVIENYKKEKNFKVVFSDEEIEKYFNGIPIYKLKDFIISILEDIRGI